MTQLASDYGRYGYRRITALLRAEDWRVNHKRIERLWRREGLKVPHKQPKRRRLWLNDGSCVRLRPAYQDHVWSYDFVMDRTGEGRSFRMLTLIDEHTRECLAIDVARSLKHGDVLEGSATCSSAVGFLSTSGRTTTRSSRRSPSASGWRRWVCRRCSSSRALPGRTATSRASTASYAMSCWPASSSIPWWRPKSSSSGGGGTTTRSDRTARLVTGPPLPKRPSQFTSFRLRLHEVNWLLYNTNTGSITGGRSRSNSLGLKLKPSYGPKPQARSENS